MRQENRYNFVGVLCLFPSYLTLGDVPLVVSLSLCTPVTLWPGSPVASVSLRLSVSLPVITLSLYPFSLCSGQVLSTSEPRFPSFGTLEALAT